MKTEHSHVTKMAFLLERTYRFTGKTDGWIENISYGCTFFGRKVLPLAMLLQYFTLCRLFFWCNFATWGVLFVHLTVYLCIWPIHTVPNLHASPKQNQLQWLLSSLCSTAIVGERSKLLRKYYHYFGILLLEDHIGARLKAVVHEFGRDAKAVNREILFQWLDGRGRQPVSLKTLIEVLNDIDLQALTNGIESALQ